jgi:hypothetical protein
MKLKVSQIGKAISGFWSGLTVLIGFMGLLIAPRAWVHAHLSEGQVIALVLTVAGVGGALLISELRRSQELRAGGRIAAIGVLCLVGSLTWAPVPGDGGDDSNFVKTKPRHREATAGRISPPPENEGNQEKKDRAGKPKKKGAVKEKLGEKKLAPQGSWPGPAPGPSSVGDQEIVGGTAVADRAPPELSDEDQGADLEVKPSPPPEEVPESKPGESAPEESEEPENVEEPEEPEESEEEEEPNSEMAPHIEKGSSAEDGGQQTRV